MTRNPTSDGFRLVLACAGALAFVASLLYFAWRYAVGFESQATGNSGSAVLVDVLLFTGFALHHSLFARTGWKTRLARLLPPELERSTYVWIASLLFIGVCAAWQTVPGMAWEVGGAARWFLHGVQVAGAAFTVVAARRLDVFELAGVRQAQARQGIVATLDDTGPYGLVRHPIYLAWLALVWAAPVMTMTRFVFAATSTVYLVVAIPFEERDLKRTFGPAYDAYSAKVRYRLVPRLW